MPLGRRQPTLEPMTEGVEAFGLNDAPVQPISAPVLSTPEMTSPVSVPPPEPEEEDKPSLLGAAFRQENMIVSAIDAVQPDFKPEEGHDPLEVIAGSMYEEQYLDNFVGSRSEAETRHIMSRISREEKDRERIAAGGAWGFAAALAAGMADPTILIPVGGVAKTIKGTVSVGRTMAKVGAASGGAMALQEAGLQATQEVRPWQESAMAIGGGTLLGGILGGAIGVLSKKQATKLADLVEGARGASAVLDEGAVGRIAAGADVGAAMARMGGSGEIIGGGAIKRSGLAEISPVTRLQTSEFDEARQAVRHLSDAGLMLKENSQGIATSPGGTIETRVKMWSGGLGKAIVQMDDAYSRYWFGQAKMAGRIRARAASERARWTGRLGSRLSATQFREEVGRAMVRGDRHAVPEVAEVAKAMRKEVFEPLKEAAIRARVLPEGVKAVGAESYLTRVYNRERITAQRNKFHDILLRHFRSQDGMADMIDAEVDDLVHDVIDNILGNSAFRLPGLDIVQGPRGPLKERVLKVPDTLIEDFLERDIETVARFYVRSMAPDVELAAKFGDVQMTDPLLKLKTEFNRRAAAAATDKDRVRLQKLYDKSREDLEALRDRTRNSYGLPDNIDGLLYRAGKVAQTINYMRLLGGMTLSAIPDLARPVMVYGLTRTFSKGWVPLLTAFKTHRLAAAEVKRAGTALDMVLDTRNRATADLFNDWQRGTKFERAIEGASSRFGLVSLMAPWNAVMKQMVGTIAMDGFLRAAQASALGKATKKQIENLASAGIDELLARRIWAQFDAGGGVIKRGLYLSNTEDWTDRAAVEAFRAAIVRDADRVIITPGLEKPLFMSKTWGKVVGQFKSFAFASTQRALLAGLQRPDAAFINGTLLSVALGGVATWIRSQTSNYDTSTWSNAKWAVESVDRSGLLTIFSEANNIAEKVSWGRVGLSAFTGEMASRYSSRSGIGAVLGPTPELINDVAFRLPGAAISGEWNASDTRAVRRILPYQNVFYLRRLLDQVESGVNNAFGVPEKRRK